MPDGDSTNWPGRPRHVPRAQRARSTTTAGLPGFLIDAPEDVALHLLEFLTDAFKALLQLASASKTCRQALRQIRPKLRMKFFLRTFRNQLFVARYASCWTLLNLSITGSSWLDTALIAHCCPKLEELSMENCPKLVTLGPLPSTLKRLHIGPKCTNLNYVRPEARDLVVQIIDLNMPGNVLLEKIHVASALEADDAAGGPIAFEFSQQRMRKILAVANGDYDADEDEPPWEWFGNDSLPSVRDNGTSLLTIVDDEDTERVTENLVPLHSFQWFFRDHGAYGEDYGLKVNSVEQANFLVQDYEEQIGNASQEEQHRLSWARRGAYDCLKKAHWIVDAAKKHDAFLRGFKEIQRVRFPVESSVPVDHIEAAIVVEYSSVNIKIAQRIVANPEKAMAFYLFHRGHRFTQKFPELRKKNAAAFEDLDENERTYEMADMQAISPHVYLEIDPDNRAKLVKYGSEFVPYRPPRRNKQDNDSFALRLPPHKYIWLTKTAVRTSMTNVNVIEILHWISRSPFTD